jgi:hypothetical protein
MNPFDYLNSINYTKEQLIVDDLTEKEYNPFMTNRGLSYFYDTVLLSNEMNINHHLDKKLQFDFLLNSVRKKKRFSKWFKLELSDDIRAVKEYYNYSTDKAMDIVRVLKREDLDKIKSLCFKGGQNPRK